MELSNCVRLEPLTINGEKWTIDRCDQEVCQVRHFESAVKRTLAVLECDLRCWTPYETPGLTFGHVRDAMPFIVQHHSINWLLETPHHLH